MGSKWGRVENTRGWRDGFEVGSSREYTRMA